MKKLVNGVWVDDGSPSTGTTTQPQQTAQTVSPTAQGGSPEVPTVSTATKSPATTVKPYYAGTYDQKLNDLYDSISNRPKFTYDINSDALYEQYAQQYINKGRLAMKDTMGQAAALTGGYGSSYGAQVGQQAYDAYLQQLNEVVPELYSQAYERYKDEGDNMMKQYAMLGDLKADEYNKYRDALGDYNYEQETAYNQQQDAYNRLYALIASSGYMPTDSELLAAGMTRESAENIKNEYQRGVDADQWQRDYQQQYFAWQQQSAADQLAWQQQQAADQMAMQQAQFDSELAYKYAALQNEQAYKYAALDAKNTASGNATYAPYASSSNTTYGDMASAIDIARGSGASTGEMYAAIDSAYKAGKINSSEASSLKMAAMDDRLRRPR